MTAKEEFVLILIVMEDTHGDQLLGDIQADTIIVLILIVMEDIHGDYRSRWLYTESCLNPYYNGRYSWSLPI